MAQVCGVVRRIESACPLPHIPGSSGGLRAAHRRAAVTPASEDTRVHRARDVPFAALPRSKRLPVRKRGCGCGMQTPSFSAQPAGARRKSPLFPNCDVATFHAGVKCRVSKSSFSARSSGLAVKLTLRKEALERLIFFGEQSLRKASHSIPFQPTHPRCADPNSALSNS